MQNKNVRASECTGQNYKQKSEPPNDSEIYLKKKTWTDEKILDDYPYMSATDAKSVCPQVVPTYGY